jgi:hypothetical protein
MSRKRIIVFGLSIFVAALCLLAGVKRLVACTIGCDSSACWRTGYFQSYYKYHDDAPCFRQGSFFTTGKPRWLQGRGTANNEFQNVDSWSSNCTILDNYPWQGICTGTGDWAGDSVCYPSCVATE